MNYSKLPMVIVSDLPPGHIPDWSVWVAADKCFPIAQKMFLRQPLEIDGKKTFEWIEFVIKDSSH